MDVSEQVLEKEIVEVLTGSEGGSGEKLKQPEPLYGDYKTGGFEKKTSQDFDTEFCLIPEDAFRFVKGTQPDQWERFKNYHGEKAEREFLDKLNLQISRRGTIDVLRNGFSLPAGRFNKMAFFKPANELNPDLVKKYRSNVFSVIRQLQYRQDSRQAPDLTIFLNGLPIFTVELKNPPTGQTVEDAKRQYKRDRDPREPLFSYNRCLAHFAVDTEEVYMTTELEGEDTQFLPFNKGYKKGAGNPPNPSGYRTDYFWKYLLSKDSVLDLVENFIHEFEERTEDEEGIPEQKLIFPRYHQLNSVRELLSDAKHKEVGKNYLVQHSAGSGKTFTISWLAHQLTSLHDEDDNLIFDTVIVISDRRHLDEQLQYHVRQFEKTRGLVANIDKHSDQLRKALEQGKKIVVSTLHKFPYIVEDIQEIPGQSFAIIIEEAHSSQTGKMREKMNEVLSLDESDIEGDALQDQINASIQKRAKLDNASSFAFTATPKERTLEIFGDKQPDGSYEPFSLYSMRQAIEEGFILDPLQNYTSYTEYFNLLKTIEDDPEYESSKASRLLKKFVYQHPKAVSKKSKIMVEHFQENVAEKISGDARAMVVTSSRQQAIRYKQAFDRYIEENDIPYKALVAFSGTKEVDGVEYSESDMNHHLDEPIEDAFSNTDKDYRFLVVAEKFQTGFDEPLLHTMYVDKILGGVKAVQTISRLNRIHPHKEDTMVLDFKNDPENIQQAFSRFYTKSRLKEGTDPNLLYELEQQLRDFHLFTDEELEGFADLWYPGEASVEELHSAVDPVVDRYEDIDLEEQDEFRSELKSFIQLYSFLLQVISFQDEELDKLYQFARFLYRKLPVDKSELPYEVKQYVDIDSYRVQEISSGSIEPESDDSDMGPQHRTKYKRKKEEEKDPLSLIIERLNELFGYDFDEDTKMFVDRLQKKLNRNAALRNIVEVNPPEKAKMKFEEIMDEEMVEIIDIDTEFYNKNTSNEDFKVIFRDWLFNQFAGDGEKDIEEYIEQGEGQTIEFKETLLYDVRRDQPNKDLKAKAVKEICAFANSKGGKLIIGVEDDNWEVKGLERDFKIMKKERDSFELQLNQEIANHLGEVFASQLVELSFEEVEGKTVGVITVHKSSDPVFFDEDEFYVRRGSSSVSLSGKDTQEYIKKHFD
ncbi:MAG: RNA-binding domain-containing protein [Candidatus Bipolaricaulota bacterium]